MYIYIYNKYINMLHPSLGQNHGGQNRGAGKTGRSNHSGQTAVVKPWRSKRSSQTAAVKTLRSNSGQTAAVKPQRSNRSGHKP